MIQREIIFDSQDANARGKNFQITHCRLCSLENSTAVTAAECCDPEALLETEAFDLAFEIARLPDILYKCKETVSAQNLLTYMFSLKYVFLLHSNLMNL